MTLARLRGERRLRGPNQSAILHKLRVFATTKGAPRIQVGDLNYVGSVIVGDTNGRYFEPAATRKHIVGVSVNVSL